MTFVALKARILYELGFLLLCFCVVQVLVQVDTFGACASLNRDSRLTSTTAGSALTYEENENGSHF